MKFRYISTVAESDPDKNVSNSDSGKVINNYHTANEILAMDAQSALGWSGVVGVEVCLVVSTPLLSGSKNLRLVQAQGEYLPSCSRDSDGYFKMARRADGDDKYYSRYVRTFSLPNALYAPI